MIKPKVHMYFAHEYLRTFVKDMKASMIVLEG